MEYNFFPEELFFEKPYLMMALNSVLMAYDLGTLAVYSLNKEVMEERERKDRETERQTEV